MFIFVKIVDNIPEIIENKIIDCVSFGISDRLIIFKPEKNKFVADLSVIRKGNYKEPPYDLKINSFFGKIENNKIAKDFAQKDFKADKKLLLIFAYFDEISQKISDYIWLVPSLEFRDIAEVIKTEDGEKLLRFEASLDFNKKNTFSKFLINKNDLGKILLDAFESKGKLNFGKTGFEEKKAVNLERLKEFISEARQNTYAGGYTPSDAPRLVGSSQFDFQKGDYAYRDIFFNGDKKFIGQEVVYLNSKPVWGVNYIGNTIGKLEANFLKQSLLKLSEKCRFGEVCEYEKREFKYQDQGQGNLGEFSGQEQIFVEGKSVYKLNYQGGLI